MNAPRVVALGGGHGLAASLASLRRVTDRLTAVVTVGDDGGSSGRLRAELGALPPGDLRMALAALADEDAAGQTWSELLQHRFGGSGSLSGHPVGNLLLTGLAEVLGDPVAALDTLAKTVRTCGRVLPLSPHPLDIAAEVVGLDPADPSAATMVRGQHAVATTRGKVLGVWVEPAEPQACTEAIDAVLDADWCVLGPGSWFTSVLPHVLVPAMSKALASTPARRLVVVNLAPQHGETAGFSAETHLEVLAAHAPELGIDVVLADPVGAPDAKRLIQAADSFGAEVVLADVAMEDGTPRHDPAKLAAAYQRIFSSHS